MDCSRCGEDIGAVMIFDSSTADNFFCEECHKKDMKEHNQRRIVSR